MKMVLADVGVDNDVVGCASRDLSRLANAFLSFSEEVDERPLQAPLCTLGAVFQQHPELDISEWISEFTRSIGVFESPAKDCIAASSESALSAMRNAHLSIPGLKRLRKRRGGQAVIRLFSEAHRTVRLSKCQVRGRLYATQEFFDAEKGERALRGVDADLPLPAAVRIREDGFLHFVLLDGHHRALLRFQNDDEVILLGRRDTRKAIKISFRLYARANWGKLA